ncbi:MAG: hybrid sensor histidine kinase/response regulator [Deltaproteobacteria bacterium]|nr:hybrid sensor histidine kinase/response regulator [Deltaproteobacteria bacterium]
MLPPAGNSDGTAGHSDEVSASLPVAGVGQGAPSDGSIYPHLIYLVSDDDPHEVARLCSVLGEHPSYLIKTFRSPTLALAALRSEPIAPPLFLCEQGLRELDGISLLSKVRSQAPDTVRVLLTAHADTQTMLRAINEGGIFQCVEKPWDRESLLLTVRNALERGDMVVQLRRTVAAMQHNNSALSQALRQIHSAQERLLESERMAAVGRVASGIAHEIGNQLSVLSYAEMIRDRYPDDPEVKLFTSAILTARARLGGLVGEIRDFSRVHGTLPPQDDPLAIHPSLTLSPEPVVPSLQEALSILRFDPEFRQRTISRELTDQAIANINRDKLVQVFLNLLRNALDATRPGGSISVRVLSDPLSEPLQSGVGGRTSRTPGSQPGQPGPTVRIQIDDYGDGIPAEIMPRIFEPFFTTKGDRGTGLGLGICRSIVGQHGGQLLLESPLPPSAPRPAGIHSAGTRVTIVLPRVA